MQYNFFGCPVPISTSRLKHAEKLQWKHSHVLLTSLCDQEGLSDFLQSPFIVQLHDRDVLPIRVTAAVNPSPSLQYEHFILHYCNNTGKLTLRMQDELTEKIDHKRVYLLVVITNALQKRI